MSPDEADDCAEDPAPTSGEAAGSQLLPPDGDGWLPKAETLRMARLSVMPAHAARVGERIRRREQERGKGTGTGEARLPDELRGARHLITEAVNGYRKQGIIEVQGDWIRMLEPPKRRPAHHWHTVLLELLAKGHQKPKKTR